LDKEKYYKYLFIVAGLYNIINSLIFLLASLFMIEVFPMFGVAVPPSFVWLHLTLLLIIMFGIGYFIVARDLSDNHGVVVIGGLSKVIFAAVTFIYMILGEVGFMVFALGAVDIVFVCLFVEFLLKYKK